MSKGFIFHDRAMLHENVTVTDGYYRSGHNNEPIVK
jgi:hypothetical protein